MPSSVSGFKSHRHKTTQHNTKQLAKRTTQPMTTSYSLARLLPDTATFSPEGIIHIANHSIQQLGQEFGTPLYIFDRATIIHIRQDYLNEFEQYYRSSQA